MPFYERLAYQNERFLRHGRARKDSGRTRQEMKPVRSSLLPGTSEHDIYYCDYRLDVAPESVGRTLGRAKKSQPGSSRNASYRAVPGAFPQGLAILLSVWSLSDQAPAALAHGLGIGAADRMAA